jgi:hypothetical protein
MPTIYKGTLIMRFSPADPNGALIAGRVAGFSENYWFAINPTKQNLDRLSNNRMGVACPDISVVGYRVTPYTLNVGSNRLQPQPSTVYSTYSQGKYVGFTNSPEDCLRMSAKSANNKWTMYLHAVPDDVVSSGNYVQVNAFVGFLTGFKSALLGQLANTIPVQWVGRDNSQPTFRVLSVNGPAGTMVASGDTGTAVGTGFVRFLRVYALGGLPIRGSFLCTAKVAGAGGTFTYTLQGLPDLVATLPSGTCRNDVINTAQMQNVQEVLVAGRKVGRPTGVYRGRRAKIRA